MAIKLRVQENVVRLSVSDGDVAGLRVDEGTAIIPEAYTGGHTSTEETQTQETDES